MNVLWITDITLPIVAKKLKLSINYIQGWLTGLLDILVEKNINLSVLSINHVRDTEYCRINGVDYYVIPPKCSQSSLNSLIGKTSPDVIHIHGTEYALVGMVLSSPFKDKCIISIQGLITGITRYYFTGINPIFLFTHPQFTLWNLYLYYHKFYLRSKIEIDYISKVKYVIGRTDWDKIHVSVLNSKVKYYFCNESLRSVFYKHSYIFRSIPVQKFGGVVNA